MAEKAIDLKAEKEVKELSGTMVSKLEKALLSEADLPFKTFIELSPNMIFIKKGGHVVYVNKESEKMMGYSKEEFLSPDFDFMRLIAPESIELVATNFRLQMNGQEVEPYEGVLVNKAGRKIDAIVASKMIDYQGERAVFGMVTDITGRKQAEKSLRESEENYRKLISEMCSGFVLNEIIFDQDEMPIDCRFLEVNSAFERITGMNATDLVGKTVTDVFPGTEPFWVDQCGEIAISGKPVQFKNSSKLFGRFFEVIAYSPQKGLVANIFTDICERMRIEEALRESESNFRAIAENANDAILIAIENGTYVYANRRAHEITGYHVDELLTMSFKDLVHQDELKKVSRIFSKRMVENPVLPSYETIIVRKKNKPFPAEVTISRMHWMGQNAVMIIIRDITQRKRFERAMGKIHNELERRVQERTADLIDTTEKLAEQRRELLRHKLDLENANKELVLTNTALSVLARNIDKKRDEVEKKIARSISSKIMPLLEEIKYDRIPEKTQAKLDVLDAYLNDLTSEAARSHDIIIALSAMELRVAVMIKRGFTSEQIARMLHISPHTVKTHRKNIRRKLNIKNANINLASYLKFKLGKTSAKT